MNYKDALSGGKNPRLDKIELPLSAQMKRIFHIQYEDAIEKRIFDTMDAGIYSEGRWTDEIYRATHGFIRLQAELAYQKESRRLGVQMTDFIERPHVVQAIREETYKFAEASGKSTVRRLSRTLVEGTENGETIPDLKRRIQAAFGFSDDMSNYRAEMIARTETARAYTTGTRSYWSETGVVEAVIWNAAGDACPFCLALDGRIVEMNRPFFAQGDEMKVEFEGSDLVLPFDYMPIDGPPLHPSCRCALNAKLVEVKK